MEVGKTGHSLIHRSVLKKDACSGNASSLRLFRRFSFCEAVCDLPGTHNCKNSVIFEISFIGLFISELLRRRVIRKRKSFICLFHVFTEASQMMSGGSGKLFLEHYLSTIGAGIGLSLVAQC